MHTITHTGECKTPKVSYTGCDSNFDAIYRLFYLKRIWLNVYKSLSLLVVDHGPVSNVYGMNVQE